MKATQPVWSWATIHARSIFMKEVRCITMSFFAFENMYFTILCKYHCWVAYVSTANYTATENIQF